MATKTLTNTAFLLVLLGGWQTGVAQEKMPASPVTFANGAGPVGLTDILQQRLLQDAANAVINIESEGDRTVDAIENSQITITLDTIPDSSRLGVLCNKGGKSLNAFAQSLAVALELQGKVSEATCVGTGHDDDPFGMKFSLHYENGETGLFSEHPPTFPFTVAKLTEDEPENDTENSASAEFEPRASTEQHPPVILDPRRSQTSHAVVQLAQGWTPVKLPDPMHADSTFGTFDSTTTFSNGILTIDRKLVLKRNKVETAELPVFQKWAEQVEGGFEVALNSAQYGPDRKASVSTEQQKKAMGLIFDAEREIQSHELDKADATLNQVEAIDPGFERLNERRAEVAEARHDYLTALSGYRKELEAYPDDLIQMNSIAHIQGKMKDKDGEIATLQRWIAADSNSCLAATLLMLVYHETGRDDLAARVGDDAMNTMTKDAKRCVAFLRVYGREQMLMGQVTNAKNTLEDLLDLTVDDKVVNDAAYSLSEVGLSLDRAEQAVREALTQFDPDETASGLSTTYANGSTSGTNLLLATWDTLGWILYQEGRIHEAEGYVRAAWQSQQDIAISRHLGAILTAEEKPVDAIDVYTLGLAKITSEDAARMAKDRDGTAVRDAIAQLKQKGIVTTVKDSKASLLALRTIDLGPAAKPVPSTHCTVRLTSSRLVADISGQLGAEGPVVVSDRKLVAGFLPSDSKAELTLEGTIQCTKTCSIVFSH